MNKSSVKQKLINFSIIIPNYNGADFLPDCLNSLIVAIKNCPQSNFEIIIVDNASYDKSLKKIKEFENSLKIENCKLKIIKNTSNYGFAYSVNQGINLAKHPYVCICNNDIILNPNWFKKIATVIENKKTSKIATFFGTVLNRDGTKFESQGFKFDYSGKCPNLSNGLNFSSKVLKNYRSNVLIWGAPAAAVVYHKKIIQKIGLFDPDFFAYLEDVDLSFRLNRLDYQTLYIPLAISHHIGRATSQRMGNLRYRLVFRNWFYLIIKNYSLKDFLKNFFPIIIERIKLFFEYISKTIKIYQYKSIILLPIDLLKTFFEIIVYSPKMLYKHYQIKKIAKID